MRGSRFYKGSFKVFYANVGLGFLGFGFSLFGCWASIMGSSTGSRKERSTWGFKGSSVLDLTFWGLGV